MLDVELKAEGLSDVTKKLMELPGIFRRARASALRSVGWELQQEIKRAGVMGVSELGWEPIHPHTLPLSKGSRGARTGRWVKMMRGRGKSRARLRHMEGVQRSPMARLINAIRYRVDQDAEAVTIGFLREDANLIYLAKRLAKGFTTKITPRMRRFAFALGFPLRKETTQLVTPPRPWISAIYERERADIPRRFEEKFHASLTRYLKEGAKA